MESYKTGFISMDVDCSASLAFRGKWFSLRFEEPKDKTAHVNNKVALELVVDAVNETTYERALRLFASSYYVFNGCHPLFDLERHYPTMRSAIGMSDEMQGHAGFSGLTFCCKICVAASFRKRYQRALYKYMLACNLHSNEHMDLSPREEHIPISPFEDDKVRFAYAIIVFYSVIEELGLEVRASQNKPSMIEGKWNEVVLSELLSRLGKAKVDTGHPLPWSLRYRPTRIEKARPLRRVNKTSWAFGPIRDSLIGIADAIAWASWIRSRVSSHRLNEGFSSISVYDVDNANHLARRLILEGLGCWKAMQKLGSKE